MKNVFTENSVLQIDQDNLMTHTMWSMFKHVCLKNTRMSELSKLMIPDTPEVHHEIEKLNIDKKSIRERIEEDMDFKIPGLPHSTVKQLQSANVRDLIQKIENHPHRHAFQRELQQCQSFYPFNQEKKWFMKLGTSNCANYSTRNLKRSAKFVYHTGTSASSNARAGTSCKKEQRRIRNSSSTRWSSLLFLTTI